MLQKSSRIDAHVRFLVPEAAFERFLPFVIGVRFVVYIVARRCRRWTAIGRDALLCQQHEGCGFALQPPLTTGQRSDERHTT
jgi:hypothetical protein